jgi:hypothetical protein
MFLKPDTPAIHVKDEGCIVLAIQSREGWRSTLFAIEFI